MHKLRFARTLFAASLFMLPFFAGGCVQQDKYDELQMANRSLTEQMVSLEAERDAARENLDTLRKQLGAATGDLESLRKKYNMSDEELRRLAAELDAAMNQVSGLDFGPLPEDLSKALTDLAGQYPDVLTFDERRGMLRFASDFTFALGSADLTANANASISKLAQILNTSDASNFEARVIGHTDNVPITKAPTRQLHPTNWHLSAHRAISVGSSLIRSGVSPQRLQVAGYGEYRPMVTNPARGGSAENRRVEIYLTPMPDMAAMAPGEAPASVSGQPRINSDEPMK